MNLVLSKQAVKTATNWVNDNCNRGDDSISCSYSWKRDLNKKSKASLDKACQQLMQDSSYVLDGGFSFRLVKDIFKEVDGKDNQGKLEVCRLF